MASPRSAVTKAVSLEREKAQAIDDRRQAQIQNQIDIINRLSDQGGYDDVMKDLVERLSDTQVRLRDAEAEIARLQAEQS